MKKFQNLGKLLSKTEQAKIKGGCTPEEMCDPDDVQACGGMVSCNCGGPAFNCCRNAMHACLANHGCPTTGWACA